MNIVHVSTTHAKLDTVPIIDGQVICCSDGSADLYWDLNGKRFHIGAEHTHKGEDITSGKISLDILPITVSSSAPANTGTPNTLYFKVEG